LICPQIAAKLAPADRFRRSSADVRCPRVSFANGGPDVFRIAAATALLLTGPALSVAADDVTPALRSGVWYADVRGVIMGTRYEYTFRKDGTFKVQILTDAPTPPAAGTWKVVARGGKQVLVLDTKEKRDHLLPAESEVNLDKAKGVLVCRKKDGTEVVLKFRKGR
jgi:hypothetical protein